MFSLEEIADFFRVQISTVRLWIVKQKLVEFRLIIRDGRARPFLDPEQFAKLLDIKAPIYGSGSELDKTFNWVHRMSGNGGRATAIAKLAKAKAQKPTK